jgi:hypothetical protein
MRKRLGLISLGIMVVLALMVTGASTTVGAKTVSACPTQTSRDAVGRTWSWRVVLHGRVSCAEAIRTNLAYIRAAREGRCPSRICTEVTFPGGWLCSSLSAAEEKELGNGLTSGCERRGASFKVYKASSPTSIHGTRHLSEFRSSDGKIGCLINEGVPPGYEIICNALSGHPREATISKSGEVSVCNKAGVIGASSCGLGFAKGPTLADGQRTEAHGFRCTSATNGLTCTKVAGAGKGKGFRINKNEAVGVG